MSHRNRNKAVILMVLLQLTLSLAFIGIASPITFTPSTNVMEQRVIVLPVYSNATVPSTSIGEIQRRMDNVASFFEECSYSLVSVTSLVVGWIEVDSPMDSYTGPWSIGGIEHGGVSDRIFIEAISKVDAEIDFSRYDRLVVVHSGESDQDHEGNETKISTCHKDGWFATGDGKIFLEASIVSEYDEFGTIAHELGHGFGATDLYDYYSEYSAWTGIGYWGLMNVGNYLGNPSGTMPCHMSVFNKHLIGWVSDQEIITIQNESVTVDLVPVSIQTKGYRAIRYDLSNGLYYLIEARSQVGYDADLSGSGVLVMLVNESRLAERRDGVQLQIPMYADGLYDAALRKGEVFHDPENNLSVRVTEFSDDLATVEVSTSPVENWAVSERISFAEGLDISDVYISTADDNFYDNNTVFAAVVLDGEYDYSIGVYISYNRGRDWEFMFNTNETDYRFSTWGTTFNYYRGMVMLTGRLYESEGSFLGVLGYSINSASFFTVNFTDIANYSHYEAVSISSPDAFYICCRSRLNGTSGITYIRLNESGWSTTFRPIPELLEVQISNVPNIGEDPFVLYRDGNRHLRLVRFNETSIIYNVTSVNDGVWNIDVVCSHNSIAISYLDTPENNSFNVFNVEIGSSYGGFSDVIVLNRTEYLRPVSLSYNNISNMFSIVLSVSRDLSYFEFVDTILTKRSIDIIGTSSCFLPRVDYSSSNLILVKMNAGYNQDALASVDWIPIPTNPLNADVYYYRPISSLVFPPYVIPAIALSLIIIGFYVISSDAPTKLYNKLSRKKIANLREGIASFYLKKTGRLRVFFLNPLFMVANIIVSLAIFYLIMQLPIIGSAFSRSLHNLWISNLLDPVSIFTILTNISSLLIYLVQLEKPIYYIKYIVWGISIALVFCTWIGWNFGIFSGILIFPIWIPLWVMTSKEIIRTRSASLLEIVVKSLPALVSSDEEHQMVAFVTESLEYLNKKSVKVLNDALTDEVLFSGDILAIVDSIFESLIDLPVSYEPICEIITRLPNPQ